MISRKQFLHGAVAAALAGALPTTAISAAAKPNIVFILADDIGYGDLGCYGANKVKTPNLDRLAHEGRRFTDAHSPAAVCTPTRYGFITGQYAWRNLSGDHILSGVAPLSIDITKPTLPSTLKQMGYATGIVGKWHLGLGSTEHPVDYNKEIGPGPIDVGFDYSFIIPATGDRVPCVFVENQRVVGLDPSDPIQVSYDQKVGDDPTGLEHPELLKIKSDQSHSKTIVNGVSRIGYMSGGKSARWVDEEIPETLVSKSVAFLEQHKERPFFLFLATHDIHEPMVPNARFKGSSECGSRGDVIQQLDWTVGKILGALDRLHLSDNTLVIFTSDNGGAIKDTYDDGTNALHSLQPPNGTLRGEKSSLFEGGNRVPFIARWPGQIPKESTSDALISLVDMLATFAAISGAELSDAAAPDSVNVLSTFTDTSGHSTGRANLVMQTNGAAALAIRKGPWKLIVSRVNDPKSQCVLYNLQLDPAEQHDMSKDRPEVAAELRALLDRIRDSACSRKL